MSENVLGKYDLSELLKHYEDAARSHEAAIKNGAPRQADKCTLRAQHVFEELVRRGKRDVLLVFLDHPTPIVALFAAAEVIKFAPSAAIPVLEKLAKDEVGIASLDAEALLDLYRHDEGHN